MDFLKSRRYKNSRYPKAPAILIEAVKILKLSKILKLISINLI